LRWFSWTIGAVVAALMVDFALSNNVAVGPIGLWPFLDGITMPLYLALVIAALFGLLVGWLIFTTQAWKKRRRQAVKTEP
jgi:uncharacterized integral membrane protein